jgi:hypothetical protein
MRTPDSPSPVFILGTSRSGTTLLRFIIDSHPEFACPPETGLPLACAQLARVWKTTELAGSGDRWTPDDPLILSAGAATAIRQATDQAMAGYLRARGKTRWCDKSLEAFQMVDVIAQVYPDAKFLVLTRHVMDVIASGVEACPWGLSRFGYDPYVAAYPGNSVAAIGAYWLACVQASVGFSDKHPERCHLLRYEDLVTAPEEVMARVFGFLGAQQVPGIAEACFRTPHDQDGPGDEKIWFTEGVHDASVGRGVSVPVVAIPPPMREAINGLLDQLGYRAIGDGWNAVAGRPDPRTSQRIARAEGPLPLEGDGSDPAPAELDEAVAAIRARIEARRPDELDDIGATWTAVAATTVGFVVEAPGGRSRELRWDFGSSSVAAQDHRPGDISLFIADAATWMSVLSGRSNLIAEVMSRRLRCVNHREPVRLRSDVIHAAGALLGLARMPVARVGAAVSG